MTSPDLPTLCERLEEDMGVTADVEAPVIATQSVANISVAFPEDIEERIARLINPYGWQVEDSLMRDGPRVDEDDPRLFDTAWNRLTDSTVLAYQIMTLVRSEATITAASPASGMNENPSSPSPPRVGRG